MLMQDLLVFCSKTDKITFFIPDCKVVWRKGESFHVNNVPKETKNIKINADQKPSKELFKTQRKEIFGYSVMIGKHQIKKKQLRM